MLLPCEDRSPGSLAGTECRGPPPRPRAPAATLSPVRREQRTHRAESQTQDSNPALLILNPALLCLALSGPCIHDRGMKKRLGDGPHDSKAYRHSHSHFPSDLVVESPGHLKKKKKDEGPSLCPGQPAADVGARFSTCREAGRNKLSPTRAPLPPPGEARVMAGGWAEPCLAPPHETPGIAGIWGSQHHHLLSACIMDVV